MAGERTVCDGGSLHEQSYRRGLEIGLRAALCCKGRAEIEACLAQVVRAHDPTHGEAEWQSWMVELEMQGWDESQAAARGAAGVGE